MKLNRIFGYSSVRSIPFQEFECLKRFEKDYVYCSYIELDTISNVKGTILLSIYTSEEAKEKLFGDIICYPLEKTGVDKFIFDRVVDVDLEKKNLPYFKYISDSGSSFYLFEGKYILMSAIKVQNRNVIEHLNHFFIHSAIHIRFRIVLEYFKSKRNLLDQDEKELYKALLMITNLDKTTKRFSEDEKQTLISKYLSMEIRTPSYKNIPDNMKEKVLL